MPTHHLKNSEGIIPSKQDSINATVQIVYIYGYHTGNFLNKKKKLKKLQLIFYKGERIALVEN